MRAGRGGRQQSWALKAGPQPTARASRNRLEHKALLVEAAWLMPAQPSAPLTLS